MKKKLAVCAILFAAMLSVPTASIASGGILDQLKHMCERLMSPDNCGGADPGGP